MRGPERVSAAVRLPDGEIAQEIWETQSWYRRRPFLGWPIIRGVVSLAEAVTLGIRTLNWSADIALKHDVNHTAQKSHKLDSLGRAATLVIAVLLAVILFMLIPYELASLLKTDKNQPLFHLVAGSTRITLFLAYIWIIALLKDVRRIFQYHGAEHQAIFTYEKGGELTKDNARLQSRFHPRCGTSFLLIVALLTMLLFVLFDVFVTARWGNYPNALIRLLVHLPFLPMVAGLSYEFLRLSDRFSDTGLFRLLIAPGLALQKITTSSPDDSQREVALAALQAAFSGIKASDEPETELVSALDPLRINGD